MTKLASGDGAKFTIGDKAAFNFAGAGDAATDATLVVKNPDGIDLTFLVNAGSTQATLKTIDIDGKEATLSLQLNAGWQAPAALEQIVTFKGIPAGSLARADSKLYDLEKFWDSQGRFMLVDAQKLTVTQGDGKQAIVTLYANDTLKDVADKLNKAIAQDLGQGAYVDNASNFVTFVGAPSTTGLEAVEGTLVIRSVISGSVGEISFAGDEDLLNALSLSEIQKAKETDYFVTITDAHSGKAVVTNERVTGNRLVGKLHPNVDVEFDMMSGLELATWNATDRTYVLAAATTPTVTYLHLADNTTVFQIGANEGEDMGINIGDIRSAALGLNSVLVTDRNSAARSITVIDGALDKVSTQRAKLGAYQNRLEHTITNLTVASENLTASESRIRDTDMAKEMMDFTKLQIMLQAGTGMLAQANTLPQYVLSLVR
ncbi:MAG: hypothetical protein LBQ90_10100 [Synergistaceae bacterium]|nr:hypothetical protein [Synergistaceae bacterium]